MQILEAGVGDVHPIPNALHRHLQATEQPKLVYVLTSQLHVSSQKIVRAKYVIRNHLSGGYGDVRKIEI